MIKVTKRITQAAILSEPTNNLLESIALLVVQCKIGANKEKIAKRGSTIAIFSRNFALCVFFNQRNLINCEKKTINGVALTFD